MEISRGRPLAKAQNPLTQLLMDGQDNSIWLGHYFQPVWGLRKASTSTWLQL